MLSERGLENDFIDQQIVEGLTKACRQSCYGRRCLNAHQQVRDTRLMEIKELLSYSTTSNTVGEQVFVT